MRVMIAMLLTCTIAVPSFADDTPRSTGARVGWTLAGAGIGFGLGTYIGFQKFDQATYAERKITTTAVSFAAAGGLIAFLLTRNKGAKPQPSLAPGSATLGAPRLRQLPHRITSLSSTAHSVGSIRAAFR